MLKYIKSKLSIKIFLINIIALMAIVGCTVGFISIFMPRSFSDSLNKDLDEKALQLVDFLKDYTGKCRGDYREF